MLCKYKPHNVERNPVAEDAARRLGSLEVEEPWELYDKRVVQTGSTSQLSVYVSPNM